MSAGDPRVCFCTVKPPGGGCCRDSYSHPSVGDNFVHPQPSFGTSPPIQWVWPPLLEPLISVDTTAIVGDLERIMERLDRIAEIEARIAGESERLAAVVGDALCGLMGDVDVWPGLPDELRDKFTDAVTALDALRSLWTPDA